MSQPRILSAFEAVTNVTVGYALALAAQLAVFPILGVAVTGLQSLGIGVVFTALSLIRSYLLRRLFDRLGAD